LLEDAQSVSLAGQQLDPTLEHVHEMHTCCPFSANSRSQWAISFAMFEKSLALVSNSPAHLFMISSRLFPLSTEGAALTRGAVAVAGVGAVVVDRAPAAEVPAAVPVPVAAVVPAVVAVDSAVLAPNPNRGAVVVVVVVVAGAGVPGFDAAPRFPNNDVEVVVPGVEAAGLSAPAVAAEAVAGVVADGWVALLVAGAVAAGLPHVNPPRPPTGVLVLGAAAACPRALSPDFAGSCCPSVVVVAVNGLD
jgi:hypothetical protein